MAKPKVRVKRKVKLNIPEGIAHIKSTFNNTQISFSDKQGNVIAWSSAGALGYKGSRKSTPFAAQSVVEDAAKRAVDQGLKKVEVMVKGPGPGREAAIRAIQASGIDVSRICDVTPMPHNGCKPPKRRRV